MARGMVSLSKGARDIRRRVAKQMIDPGNIDDVDYTLGNQWLEGVLALNSLSHILDPRGWMSDTRDDGNHRKDEDMGDKYVPYTSYSKGARSPKYRAYRYHHGVDRQSDICQVHTPQDGLRQSTSMATVHFRK